MKSKEEKTNVMRILEQKKIPYAAHYYEDSDGPEGTSEYGVRIAAALGQDVRRVFKTLVGRGASGAYAVFVIPAAESLDLKKAARAAGEKAVELLAVKELNAVTGYLRGGCSPIGMKKQFLTLLHETAEDFPAICVSGGRIGAQVELSPAELLRLTGGRTGDLTGKE